MAARSGKFCDRPSGSPIRCCSAFPSRSRTLATHAFAHGRWPCVHSRAATKLPLHTRFWRPDMKAQEATTTTLHWLESLKDRVSMAGLTWAKQGLSTGKMALESGATKLSQTADTLGELAEKLERTAKADPSGKHSAS